MDATQQPHRRYNPLKDEWIIVAPQRVTRPWQGQTEKQNQEQPQKQSEAKTTPSTNPLYPGATRPNGEVNDDYTSTFVFDNDFPAFLINSSYVGENDKGSLFRSQNIQGTCRVMCFHPDSNKQLATMSSAEIAAVIVEWCRQLTELGAIYAWVQIFENKGAVVGCSNGHPHCQIWAGDFLPNEPATKHSNQRLYWERSNGKVMLLDYLEQELAKGERIVEQNDHWVVLVPYWAVWPYETMLLPKRHILRLTDINATESDSLAVILKRLLIKYDNLFNCSFPYSMGWHGAPTGEYLKEENQWWQLHAVWVPPLLRSASVKKFMAGYELICEPQRDLTAEMAAKTLRALPEIHYTQKGH